MNKHTLMMLSGFLTGVLMIGAVSGCAGKALDITGKYSLVRVTVDSVDVVFEGSNLEIYYPPSSNYIDVTDESHILIVIDNEAFECSYTISESTVRLSGNESIEQNASLTIDGELLVLVLNFDNRSVEYCFAKSQYNSAFGEKFVAQTTRNV